MFLEDFGKRVKNRRIELGMSQEQLAQRCGYTARTTIVKIEKGEIDVPQSKIELIAKALQVKPTYLMGWNESVKGDNFNFLSPNVVNFDVCGYVRAGYNGACECEYTGENVQIPSSKLKGRSASDFFVLRVSGDSMFPRILDGDKVLVLRTESVDSGKIAVVMYGDNEATIKKVTYDATSMTLIPFNTNYSPLTIRNNDLNECRVLGEVISLIRDF